MFACRYGVTPNMLIVPNQISLYMTMAPEEKTVYQLGGDKALAEFEAGAQGFLSKSFRGCAVVTSDPFEVSDGALWSPESHPCVGAR